MNCQRALDLLMSRLGNRTEPELRANCLLEMEQVQTTLLERGPTLPWFLLNENLTLNSTANDPKVVLPADFLREHDEGALYYENSSGVHVELNKDDYDALSAKWGLDATGDVPVDYAIVGGYIILFPTPTTAFSLLMSKYYKKEAVPTDSSGSENAWFKYASDVIIAETGIVVAGLHLRDAEIEDKFRQDATRARGRMHVENVAREEANRTRSMGDD